MSAKAELAALVSIPSGVTTPEDDTGVNWSPRDKNKKEKRRGASPEAVPYGLQQLIDQIRPDLQLNRGGLAQTKAQKGQIKATGDDDARSGKTDAARQSESQPADLTARTVPLGWSGAGQHTQTSQPDITRAAAVASATVSSSGQAKQSDKNCRQSAAADGLTTQPQGHSAATPPANTDPQQVATPAPQPKSTQPPIAKHQVEAPNNALSMEYRFQGWTGNHSVKLSAAPRSLQESVLMLQPSSLQVGQVMNREMEHWQGNSTMVVVPTDEDEGQQQQQRHSDEQPDPEAQ
ncbi:hypothetical protein SGGMMB4_01307 [Sodalis glossinidius str. 'morsitans']|uniref:Type III secretion apparatus SpaN n=2 Tax=Sodalis glossinidius TaxID=63612 RepID=Q2NVI3_SODGM|nr:type III secretion apparatus SpaN [Sodalis glossinidius]AAS66844.1 YsaP [Sodalis glossinidius]BAE73842.1 type III secretion apparatus SpaN [Sodalis glossinidius str. 'morsitans']CRL44289.1 hypothetical protein SGGMMB4_01307 [Sodalis glossinidius str. 'morsitans']